MAGYHDIRTGNEPDDRLKNFLGVTLPSLAEGAREKFEQHKDLLQPFADGTMPYHEFAARVMRRYRGENEDGEFERDDPADWV